MAEKTESITAKVVDFTNVREGGATFNKKRVPAGDYLAKITKTQDAPAKDGVHQWLYTVELQQAHTDRKFPYYCKLQENQLWKLRNLFLACGLAVPKKKVKVDPAKIVGKLIGITLEDDEYEGKLQSSIAAVFPANELEDAGSDDDLDDEDTEDEDDEEEEEEAPAPVKKAKKKPAPAPVEEEDDEDEEEDEDEEDDEPEPPKKVAKKAAPAKKAVAKKKAPVEDDDDLEELDLDDI